MRIGRRNAGLRAREEKGRDVRAVRLPKGALHGAGGAVFECDARPLRRKSVGETCAENYMCGGVSLGSNKYEGMKMN
jgi:hypothetical protein